MLRPPRSSAQSTPPIAKAADAASDVVVTGEKIAARAAPAPPSPSPSPSPAMAAPVVMARVAPEVMVPPPYHDIGRDRFTAIRENPFKLVREEPVSTFWLDVDTASYPFMRASLNRNFLPQLDAVRTEEMVNYFPYDYAPARSAAAPFSTNTAVFPSPWSPGRLLVRIGVKG